MQHILVTGGTGTLGRHVVPQLQVTGRKIRVLSRTSREAAEGIEFVTGDLATGKGVEAAVEGTEIIVHCAGSRKGDEDKTRNLVRAASQSGVRHLVYISVVGADRVPVVSGLDRAMFGYFASKLASERIVAASGLSWTTLRATQFHDAFLAVARVMAKSPIVQASALRHIDVAGALCAAAATICLLLGLTWGGSSYPWTSVQARGLFIAAALLTIAFFLIERKVVEPILPLDLLRNQIFATGSLLSLTYGLVSFGIIFYLPLFIQAVLGQTSISSTAALTPLLLGLTGGSIVTGWLVAKYKRYQALTLIGAIILLAGAVLLATLGTTTALLMVTLTAIVMGVGLGVINNTFMLAVQNAIPRERLGVGTGAIAYLRTIGQTVGTAILGALLINMSTSQRISAAGRQALASGLHAGFLVMLGVSVVILLLTLFLKDVPLRERTPATSEPATPTETNQP